MRDGVGDESPTALGPVMRVVSPYAVDRDGDLGQEDLVQLVHARRDEMSAYASCSRRSAM